MAGVPNIFANATTTIPLVELDQNFATQITIGQTSVGLGNTVNAFTPNTTAGIIGTTLGDSANVGSVGEYQEANLQVGSAVNVPTDQTPVDIAELSLTAGDWDIEGTIAMTASSNVTTFGYGSAWVNTSSATVPVLPITGFTQTISGTNEINQATLFFPTGTRRVSLSTSFTIFLSARAAYSSGNVLAYGIMRARRVR